MNIFPKAIFLMGPTASGKTSLALELSKHLPVELISVDSGAIYKGMDIGTSKPSKKELLSTPHRLLNILDPVQSYSVAQFRQDALMHMQEISNTGRIPLLVGGTMLYYKILLNGLSPMPSANIKIRQYIKNIAIKNGWHILFQWLKKIDPHSSNHIHPNDSHRVARALEVFLISGKLFSELKKKNNNSFPYKISQFALVPLQKELLHQRIEIRFKNMLQMGFENEVLNLFSRHDLHIDLPSIRCVGYRQMWEYFLGKINKTDMIFKSICATKQIAKRQMSWLRNWDHLVYINMEKKLSACHSIIKHFETKKNYF